MLLCWRHCIGSMGNVVMLETLHGEHGNCGSVGDTARGAWEMLLCWRHCTVSMGTVVMLETTGMSIDSSEINALCLLTWSTT